MTSITNYEFADIILVPFPFTNQLNSKKRPAVIISTDQYNQNSPDLIIMAITSQNKPDFSYGSFSVEQWQLAGLLKPSFAKPIITTIQNDLPLKKLGKLQSIDIHKLKTTLIKILNMEI